MIKDLDGDGARRFKAFHFSFMRAGDPAYRTLS